MRFVSPKLRKGQCSQNSSPAFPRCRDDLFKKVMNFWQLLRPTSIQISAHPNLMRFLGNLQLLQIHRLLYSAPKKVLAADSVLIHGAMNK